MCIAMKMKKALKQSAALLVLAGLVPLFSIQAASADDSSADARPQATIHNVNLGGIRDWRAIDSRSLRVTSSRNRVYLVELSHPCHSLRFANTVAFMPEPNGNLTRFSSLIARDERCWFRSIVEITGEEEAVTEDDATEAGEAEQARGSAI